MDALHHEGHQARLVGGGADDASAPGSPLERRSRARAARARRRRCALEAEPCECIDRGTEADGAADVRRAGLELVGQCRCRSSSRSSPTGSCRRRPATAASRRAAPRGRTARRYRSARTACGRKSSRNRSPAPARPPACAAPPGRRRRAPARRARWRARDHRAAPEVWCRARWRRGRRRRCACAVPAAPRRLELDLAARDPWARRRSRAPVCLAEHLPGHDVGVVLQLGDQHLVAGPEPRPGVALRHQIDGLGRAAHEDDLLASSAH